MGDCRRARPLELLYATSQWALALARGSIGCFDFKSETFWKLYFWKEAKEPGLVQELIYDWTWYLSVSTNFRRSSTNPSLNGCKRRHIDSYLIRDDAHRPWKHKMAKRKVSLHVFEKKFNNTQHMSLLHLQKKIWKGHLCWNILSFCIGTIVDISPSYIFTKRNMLYYMAGLLHSLSTIHSHSNTILNI